MKLILQIPFLSFFFIILVSGCFSTWKYLKPLDPYTRKPLPKGKTVSISSSGVRIRVEKFYYLPEIACLGVVVDNSRGYAEAYIDPKKTRLVAEKLGTWALTSTQAAREPIYRRFAAHFHKITDPSRVKLWSLLYLPMSRIPVGKEIRGLVCFQLIRYPGDPQPIKIRELCRVKFEDLRVGGGKVDVQWLWFKRERPRP